PVRHDPVASPLSGPITISPEVISNGGGSSSGGAFTLDDAVGEVSAAGQQTGGQFTFDGGFWNVPQDFSPPCSSVIALHSGNGAINSTDSVIRMLVGPVDSPFPAPLTTGPGGQ